MRSPARATGPSRWRTSTASAEPAAGSRPSGAGAVQEIAAAGHTTRRAAREIEGGARALGSGRGRPARRVHLDAVRHVGRERMDDARATRWPRWRRRGRGRGRRRGRRCRCRWSGLGRDRRLVGRWCVDAVRHRTWRGIVRRHRYGCRDHGRRSRLGRIGRRGVARDEREREDGEGDGPHGRDGTTDRRGVPRRRLHRGCVSLSAARCESRDRTRSGPRPRRDDRGRRPRR